MSADNGVYILETEGPEYRVAHLGAIDNLEWDNMASASAIPEEPNYDDVRIFNARWMWRASPVYKTKSEATRVAISKHDKIGWSEYGICTIKIPRKF